MSGVLKYREFSHETNTLGVLKDSKGAVPHDNRLLPKPVESSAIEKPTSVISVDDVAEFRPVIQQSPLEPPDGYSMLEDLARDAYSAKLEESKDYQGKILRMPPGYVLDQVVSFGHIGGSIGRFLGFGGTGNSAFLLKPEKPTDKRPAIVVYPGTGDAGTFLLDIDPRGIGRSLLNWRGNGINSEISQWMWENGANGVISTGHSLGGTLANLTAIYAPPGVRVKSVSFGAPGIHKDAAKDWEKMDKTDREIISFEGELDTVAQWGWRKVGKVYQIPEIEDHAAILLNGIQSESSQIDNEYQDHSIMQIESEQKKWVSERYKEYEIWKSAPEDQKPEGIFSSNDGLDRFEKGKYENLGKMLESKKMNLEKFEEYVAYHLEYKKYQKEKDEIIREIRRESAEKLREKAMREFLGGKTSAAEKFNESKSNPFSRGFWSSMLHRTGASLLGWIPVLGVAIGNFFSPFLRKLWGIWRK